MFFFCFFVFKSFNLRMNFCNSGLIQTSWWCPICCMYLYWLIWHAVYKGQWNSFDKYGNIGEVHWVVIEALMTEVIEHLNILDMKELLLWSWDMWSFCPSVTEMWLSWETNQKLTGCITKPFIILNKSPIRRHFIHCTPRQMHTIWCKWTSPNQEIYLIAKYVPVLWVMTYFCHQPWIHLAFIFQEYLITKDDFLT